VSDMISVKDQERAYAAYMGHSAEWIIEALRKGPDPAMDQLVTWAIRSAQMIGPGGPGNVARPAELGEPMIGKEAVDKLLKSEWEHVVNVFFAPGGYRMDKPAWNELKGRIESAIWLLQNVEALRGGKSFDGFKSPEEFWADWDRYYKPGATGETV
jgi:hypothetical protein